MQVFNHSTKNPPCISTRPRSSWIGRSAASWLVTIIMNGESLGIINAFLISPSYGKIAGAPAEWLLTFY